MKEQRAKIKEESPLLTKLAVEGDFFMSEMAVIVKNNWGRGVGMEGAIIKG